MGAIAGSVFTVFLNWYNEENGTLDDPLTAQIDITYGSAFGVSADVTGPWFYSGASTPTTQQIYRLSQGVYAFDWAIPLNTVSGVYTVTWTVTYGAPADSFPVTENIYVGGVPQQMPAQDIGYWSGSFIYQPPYATPGGLPYEIDLGAIDENGTAWILNSIKGWDGVTVVGSVLQRAADHGGFATSQYLGPRLLTITITASAPSQALRDVARSQMQQIIPVNDLAVFTYNEPVPKFAQIRLNGSAGIDESYPTLTDVVFTIPCIAPDPRKYSVTLQQESLILPTQIPSPLTLPTTTPFTLAATVPPGLGSMLCTNYGTFETRPILIINGPIPAPIITNLNTGQSISFSNLTLGAADQLVVSMDQRLAFLNGVVVPADISSSWWVLWPGDTSVQLANGTGTGAQDIGAGLSAQWYSAYN